MAKGNNNLFLKNISGQIGKQLIIKQYNNQTIITAYPNMPKDKPTELQLLYRKRFNDAVIYARGITGDYELNAAYQKKLAPGKRVFNYAIAEYLKKIKQKEGPLFFK